MEEALNEDDVAKEGNGRNDDDSALESNSGKDLGDAPDANIGHQVVTESSETSLTPSFEEDPTANAPKVERSPPQTCDDSAVFLTPTPKKSIPLKNKNQVVHKVDSSDEDDVVEVALPPKPTITIESSDEDDLQLIEDAPPATAPAVKVATSRSPSIVSSVSDDFIKNDCIALNISTKSSPYQPTFDFNLHGSDLLHHQPASAKKKKKRRNKESSAGCLDRTSLVASNATLFVTPKNKTKKRQKADSTVVKSDQSVDLTKDRYSVSTLSIPNADVYESDSNQSAPSANEVAIDLTKEPLEEMPIENILMANVTGIVSPVRKQRCANVKARYGSTRVPAILSEKLDFDNLNGKNTSTEKRYSPFTLRHEMDKFYNESWGGEDFNHTEIQKHMSKDKSLWVIDARDRFPNYNGRKSSLCFKCNRVGHREENCRLRSAICYMCGESGHYEPRCPSKICVNCGSPNFVYSAICRNCTDWGQIRCPECGQRGHPYSHCPDLWRRYHNTIDNTQPLVENKEMRRNYEQYCSGCARRGHLVHACKYGCSFAGMPLNSPYVAVYRPLYPISPMQVGSFATSTTSPQQNTQSPDRAAKRRSKSPVHTDHDAKRKSVSSVENKQSEVILSAEESEADRGEGTQELSHNHDKRGHVIQCNQISDTSDAVNTARVYIAKDTINKLKHADGEKWLKTICIKHNVTVTFTEDNQSLSVTGKVADHISFQNELKAWTRSSPRTPAEGDTHQSDKSYNIPKDRDNVLKQLEHAFTSLSQEIGDPKKLFRELTYLQNQHEFLLKQKIINSTQLVHNRNNTNGIIRKLNMVLLGQAGLANGCVHLRKLHSLHERLATWTQKYLSKDIRHEIGRHYHYIFTICPRDDYHMLMNMYYSQRKLIAKQNHFQHIQTPMLMKSDIEKAVRLKAPSLNPAVAKILSISTFTYERLMKTHPSSVGLRKRRLRLLRLLQDQLMLISSEAQVSPKAIKRLRKLRQQSQLLLDNV